MPSDGRHRHFPAALSGLVGGVSEVGRTSSPSAAFSGDGLEVRPATVGFFGDGLEVVARRSWHGDDVSPTSKFDRSLPTESATVFNQSEPQRPAVAGSNEPSPPSTARPNSSSAVVVLAGTIAGLIAGLAAAGLFQVVDNVVVLSPEMAAINSMSSKAKQDELAVAQKQNDRIETLAQGGLLGAWCALCLGVTGMQVSSVSGRLSPVGIGIGVAAATILGATGAIIGAGLPEYWGARETSENLFKEASVRGAMMVLAGIGVGVMFGRTTKARVMSAVFGLVGGALAAVVCPILISMLFPDARSEQFLVPGLAVNLSILGVAGLSIGALTAVARTQP